MLSVVDRGPAAVGLNCTVIVQELLDAIDPDRQVVEVVGGIRKSPLLPPLTPMLETVSGADVVPVPLDTVTV